MSYSFVKNCWNKVTGFKRISLNFITILQNVFLVKSKMIVHSMLIFNQL